MNKKFTRILSLLFAAIIVVSMFSFTASADGRVTRIVSCTLSEDGASLTANVTLSDEFLTVYGACGVYLFELPPYAKMADIQNYSPASELVAQENLTFTLDMTDSAPERIFNKFVLARMVDGEYVTMANVRYIDNPEVLAENKRECPKYNGTLGVCGESSSQNAVSASRAVIPVALNTLVTDTIDGSTKCEYGDNTYYISKENLIALDNKIREFTEKGCEVTLQLLLTKPDNSTSDTAMKLYKYTKKEEALYYGIDTTNADSVSVYTALVRFLSERYSRDDEVYGFVGSYIMGSNLNSNRTYNSVGETKDSKYVTEIVRALHITSNALRSEYSNVRLFLPIKSNYNSTVYDTKTESNEYLDYSSKYLLDSISASLSKSGSNVPFGIFLDASASDGSPDFWNDSLASDTDETDFVTLKNIEVLIDYLKQPEMLYEGYTRDLAVSFRPEPADAESADSDVQKYAAAALCAYYRVRENDDVSGIYFDGELSGAVSDALYGADSKSDEEIKETIKNLLGEESYSELVSGTLSSLFIRKAELSPFKEGISNRSTKTVIADFTDNDMYSFSGDSYTASVAIEISDDTGLALKAVGNADRAGILKTFDEYDISKEDVIKIRIMAQSESEKATVRITLRGKDSSGDVVLTGQTEVTSGEWTELAFAISGIKTLNYIGISAASDNNGLMTLYCKNAVLLCLPILGVKLVVTVIIWIIAIALFIILLIYARIVYLKAKKAKKKRVEIAEKLKKEEEARRQAARRSRKADKNTSKRNLERAERERKEKARRQREKAEAEEKNKKREQERARAEERARRLNQDEKERAGARTEKAGVRTEKTEKAGQNHAETSAKQASQKAKPDAKGPTKLAAGEDIPTMPKTEPKTFMVPQKTEERVSRDTLKIGISVTKAESSGGGFDTTGESKKNFS